MSTRATSDSVIYEVTYPDDRRKSSGRSLDGAVSRAFFVSLGDAERFASRNGGTVAPKTVSPNERRRLYASHMLG